MLKAKEFIERGADVVLRNLLTDDTTEFQTERPIYFYGGIDLTDHMIKGHTYYFRVTTQKTIDGLSDDAAKSSNGLFMSLFAHSSNSSTDYYFTVTFPTSGSHLYTFTEFKDTGEFWLGNPSVFNATKAEGGLISYGLFYKEWMAIDITDIYTASPDFSALSQSEQKAILDEIPFFIGYHKFSYTKDEKNYTSFEQNRVRTNELLEGSFWQSLAVKGSEDPFFEGSRALYCYNNSYSSSDESTHTPVLTKVDAPDDFPLKDSHPTVYKISFDRTKTATPDLGGFVNSFYPKKVGIFKQVMYLKAPKGLNPRPYSNYIVNSIRSFNADTTGAWQEIYIRISVSDRVTGSGGHIAFTSNSLAELPEQFDIYVGASTVLDISDHPELLHTPLFDPFLGARMTPGGLLSSDQFVEDSALSSVQILRGGAVSIKLKNILYKYDTSEWKFHEGWGFYKLNFNALPIGTKLYLRASVKHGYGTPLTDFFLRGGNYSDQEGIYQMSPESGKIYTLSNIVDVKNSNPDIKFEVGCHPNTQDILDTVRVRHCMYLDLTKIYERLPEFKALPEDAQLERLNKIPWFPDEYEITRVTEDLYIY